MALRQKILLRRCAVIALMIPVCAVVMTQSAFDHSTGVSAAQQFDAAQIAAGKKLFVGACSNSYCHGNEGAGGSGPKLTGRSFTAEHVMRVISDGVAGTKMPAFRDTYSRAEIEQLVAYVLSLAPAATAADPHAGNAPARAPAATGAATPKPVMTERDREFLKGGNAEAGRALFFDPYIFESCRVCHTFNDRGGKVGPDLSGVGSKPAEEIFQSLTSPHAAIAEKYETIVITTRTGERIAGVRRDENEQSVRIHDTSSLPPVSRAILKTEIVKTEKLNTSAMPDDYGRKYSRQQLIDLVTFLKTGG
jgi:putative heme-binding domain-containing protein